MLPIRALPAKALLAAVLLATLAPLAVAIDLPAAVRPFLGAAPAAASVANTAAPTAEDWAARLAKAREAHQLLVSKPEGSAPLLAERQLVSTRLLLLLSAEAESARGGPAAEAGGRLAAMAPPVLVGQPPYDVVEVDALRDQLDGLKSQQTSLRLSLKSLDAEVEAAVEARNSATANLNTRRDQASSNRLGEEAVLARAQAELADLQAQVAALELLQADATRQRARERLTALDAPLARLAGEIDRVRSKQRLDAATLDTLLKGFKAEGQRLAAERAKLVEQVAQRANQPAVAGTARTRELEALHQAIAALRDLESIESGKAAIWRGRQESLGAQQPIEDRRANAASLSDGIEQLQVRMRSEAERSELLRIETRSQQSLLTSLADDDAARPGERRALDALQTQLGVQERLEESLRRGVVLLTRSRAELGLDQRPDSASGWLDHLGTLAGDAVGQVWDHELFSATETTRVDGRLVTLDHGVTVGKSIGVLLMLVAGYWAAGVLTRLIVLAIARRLHLSGPFARVLGRWIKSILLLLVVLVVLKMARIPLTVFAFLGGALAIGVGFGAQNVIKNLISGVIILFERQIHVGDVITVGGMSGTVTTVDFRATTVRGFDGIDAIVPNSILLENQISNWSGGGLSVRRVVGVGVAYGSDVRRAAGLLQDCARGHAAVLADPPPEVLFDDFASDALVLRLQYWLHLGGERNGPTVDSDLRFAIEQALREAGIGIAFPQRDVHLDLAGPVRVALVGSPAPPATPAPPTPG